MRRYTHASQVAPKAPEEKDAAIPAPPDPLPSEVSIDELLSKGLVAIYGAMRAVRADIATGSPSRESIMNLKDLMAMLRDLKKDEKDLLDKMSDEDLEKMLPNASKY